jgi:hypothetical protein
LKNFVFQSSHKNAPVILVDFGLAIICDADSKVKGTVGTEGHIGLN